MEEPIPGKAIFLPALKSHVWVFSISVSAIFMGLSVNVPWLGWGLVSFGASSSILFFVILWRDFDAQQDLLNAHLDRHAAVTDSMRPQPQAKEKTPFPPLGFIQFLFNWKDKTGKYPTVKECLANHMTFAQESYQQLVDAGAWVGRIEGQSTGEPAPHWNRFRFEQMAIDN